MRKFYRFLLGFTIFICFVANVKAESIESSDSLRLSNLFDNMIMSPEEKDSLMEQAEKLVQTNPQLQEIFDYSHARYSILTGQFDQAEDLILNKINQLETKDENLYLAKYYNLYASLLAYQNKQSEVIAYYRKAIEVFEKFEANDDAAMIYFNLSNIFLGRLDYVSARENIVKARELLSPDGNLEYNSFVNAVLAVTSLKVNEEVDKAWDYAQEALEIAELSQSVQALILSNYAMGEVSNFNHEFEQAINYFKVAADLAEKFRLMNIVISSQAGLVQSYINIEDYENAIKSGKKALDQADLIDNNEIKFNLYKNIGQSYGKLEKYDSAYFYSTIALEEYLNKVNEDNQRIIQEYLLQYETEKKENLILKQEKDLKQKQNWNILLSSILILGLMGFVFYRKYMQMKTLKLKEEKEKEVLKSIDLGERKERNRLSKELHDGVASQLTAVKLLIESDAGSKNSEKALEVVRSVQKELRGIAYSILPVDFKKTTLHQAIKKFCYQISIPELQVHFFSNSEEVQLEKNTAHSLYRAVQEIIQNAIKHAEATSIHVQLIKKSGILEISIEDNGIGFEHDLLKRENTLHFLIDRLKFIDAELDIESAPNQGTVFSIIKKL